MNFQLEFRSLLRFNLISAQKVSHLINIWLKSIEKIIKFCMKTKIFITIDCKLFSLPNE